MKKVSIIVPIYNVGLYLAKCLDSLIKQSYSNIEIILIDDNSNDDSYKIATSYRKMDSRIILLRNKQNKGLSITRNIGLKVASGDYITFVDPDDYVDYDYVEFLVQLIEEDNYDMAICNYTKVVNKEKIICSDTSLKYILNQEETFAMLFANIYYASCVVAKLYKKELFKNILFPEHRIYEDIETIGKVFLKAQKFIYQSISKYNYVIRYGSLSFSDYSPLELDRISHTEQLIAKVIEKYPQLTDIAYSYYINNLLAVCNKLLLKNMYQDSVIRKTKTIISKRYFSLMKMKINFIKKIQYSLFLINVRLYKLVYKKIKKDNVLSSN